MIAQTRGRDEDWPGHTTSRPAVPVDPYTLVEALDLAERLTAIDAPRAVPPAPFRWLSRVAALAETVVTPAPMYRSASLRVLGGATYCGDNVKATRELGLDHRPFEAGFEETLAYEREQLGV